MSTTPIRPLHGFLALCMGLCVVWSGPSPGAGADHAGALDAGPLEREAVALVQSNRHVGFGLAVIGAEGVLWQGTWGERDRSRREPLRPDDPLPVGEVGELLVSALALRLWQTGALDLDAPVQVESIDLRGIDAQAPSTRQLLSHHSGLVGVHLRDTWQPDGIATSRAWPEPLPPLHLLAPPGQWPARSSLGVELVARELSRIGGSDIDALIAEQIETPLGLSAPRPAREGLGPLHSRGRAEPLRTAREHAALGMGASLEQLSGFVQALLPGAKPGWLDADALAHFYQAQNRQARPDLGQRAAFGFRLESDPRAVVGTVALIESTVPGGFAAVRVVPEHRIAVVAMANFSEARSALSDLLDEALDAGLRTRIENLPVRPEAGLVGRLPLPDGMQPDTAVARYATFAGLVDVQADGDALDVRWLGWRFTGEPRGDGWYRPRLRVLRIPIGLQALEQIAIRPVRYDGERLLLVAGPSGRQFVVGVAADGLVSGASADRWSGRYVVTNPDPLLERVRVDAVDLVHEDGLLRMRFAARGGPLRARFDIPLVPESGDWWRIPGLGPGLGDRLRLVEANGRPARLEFSGYTAERVE